MEMDSNIEKSGPVLGETWFPVREISIESVRERAASSALPPIYYLHVWFARRPLATARAAIIGALVPSNFPKQDFFKLLGIPSDVNITERFEEFLRRKSKKIKGNYPLLWKRSYTHNPTIDEIQTLNRAIESEINTQKTLLFDPMAGGGSIPLEAIRLGFPVIANDLNPVAYLCLKGTTEYPVLFREKILQEVKKFCDTIHEKAHNDLAKFFPKYGDEEIYAYLWARTVSCPHCGLIIPLSPNWWIVNQENEKIAVQMNWTSTDNKCKFQIIKNPDVSIFDPDSGTTVSGDAQCPRCKSKLEGEKLKDLAQEGKMGHQLYGVCTKIPKRSGRGKDWVFRNPTDEEYDVLENIEPHLEKLIKYIPDEEFPSSANDDRPRQYGMFYWKDIFNPRQLLTHAVYLKYYLETKEDLFKGKMHGTPDWDLAVATAVYGAMVFDSCVSYNCQICRWDATRVKIVNAMAIQGFPFKWSYSEFDHSEMLWPWSQEKTIDSLKELIALTPEKGEKITILNSDAQKLKIPRCSIDAIIVDPPYGNNVMYADISDFFYIWMKRMVGDLFPESFKTELTNKEDEVVANVARFSGSKKGQAKKLANQDYSAKMEASFLEMHRVLKDDGVLCVMFTHRDSAAWEGLAESLMNAGFTFKSSWPVHTEPGEKFGKANKGALKVTVILYCRKRKDHQPGRWEDVVDEIRDIAKEKIKEYQGYGITGPDLLVSLYGPALGKFSEYYPVKDITGKVRGIGDAFTIVAEVVNEHLTGDIKGADMEALAYLNLLRNAPGLTMEYDLARICTVFGGNTSVDVLDVKGGSGLVKKASGKVKILTAKNRFAEGILNPDRPNTFRGLMDVVHAALLIYEREGIAPVTRMLQETGRDAKDAGIISVLSAIGSIGEDASSDLGAEARIANALLEALGHSPAGIGKTGEKITHWT